MTRHLHFILCLLMLCLAGCASQPRSGVLIRGEPIASYPTPATSVSSPTIQRLAKEAALLQPLAQSQLSRQFLAAASALPSVAPRTAFINEISREYFSSAARAALPDARKAQLSKVDLDEFRYYYTKYGSPLAYMRALEFAADDNFREIAGKRILDFGYGSIGHVRLLASLGAHVTAVDPDSYLAALYSEDSDQGTIPLAPVASGWRRSRGSITLAHGYWPKDPSIVARVGGGFDLILSKNTLKRGYVKPERKVDDKRQLIALGVSDQVFLAALFNALAPGGKLVIYNLYPKPAGAKEKYRPNADGRSPFSREQYEKAGLKVIALDAEDHASARKMGRLLGWDKNPAGETVDDLDNNLFALVTILSKPSQ